MFTHHLKRHLILTFSLVLSLSLPAIFGLTDNAPVVLGASEDTFNPEPALAGPALQATSAVTTLKISQIGRYDTGLIDQNAAVGVSYDPISRRLFVLNPLGGNFGIDIIDFSTPSLPSEIDGIDMTSYGGQLTNIAVHNGLVAVSIANVNPTSPGTVAFFNAADGLFINSVTVGIQPVMLTFTPDGQKVLVANEGEAVQYCAPLSDPPGSISLIDTSDGAEEINQSDVTTIGFSAFNGATLDPSIRILGPGVTVAQDLEPENIAVSSDSQTAWITLQENNAMAILDLNSGAITQIVGLGFKDHNQPGQGLDVSDQDGGINITTWPVQGMYQSDGIATYQAAGNTYLVTANEGGGRSVPCPSDPALDYTDQVRISSDELGLDRTLFPDFGLLEQNSHLGRIEISRIGGDPDNDNFYEELYTFGTRSFSIWTASGVQVFDSGDAFEQITAGRYPNHFNSEDDVLNSKDKRSDNGGPEPETITTGTVGQRTLAFIGLEQMSGVMVYDVTNPIAPAFLQYLNGRDFNATTLATAGDLSPADMVFIPAEQSPNGKPLLVIAFKVSGTVTIFQIDQVMLENFLWLPLVLK